MLGTHCEVRGLQLLNSVGLGQAKPGTVQGALQGQHMKGGSSQEHHGTAPAKAHGAAVMCESFQNFEKRRLGPGRG